MNGCDVQTRSSGWADCLESVDVDGLFLSDHNSIISANGMNKQDNETMATDSLGQNCSWIPHQNFPHQSLNVPLKEVRLSRNGYNNFFPHSNEPLTKEVNNNSEIELLAMKTLVEKHWCSIDDVQKKTNAVVPPRVVEEVMESLSMNGYAKRIRKTPAVWTKAGKLADCSRYYGSPGSGMAERNGSSPATFHEPDHSFQMEESFMNTSSFNRSISSPSFHKSYSTFPKPPRRKISEPARNEVPKYFARQRCRSTASEDDLDFRRYDSFIGNPNPKEHLRFEDSGSPPTIAESAASGFGEIKIKLPSADCSKGSRQVKEKFTRQRRSPGVIGEERSKMNYRSRSFEESCNSPNHLRVNARHADNIRQRSKSFGSDGDVKSCGLCKIPFLTKQQYEEHLQSTKHRNKIAKVNSEPYSKFCNYCNVGLNSKSQAIEHFSSGRHEQTVAKSQKAPTRIHPSLVTNSEVSGDMYLTVTKPQDYQLELYAKAMTTNSVCFLPTGTGKNLVSAMVVAQLLLRNPTRQIIFLVDRVLLVLQQSDYLKRELQDLQIPQTAKDTIHSNEATFLLQYGQQALRSVRIGAICGEMRKLEQGVPIFNHDILVITADCYRNHINNGTLRFEDSGLIVLDESHHCNKDHPYHVIIRDYYRPDEATVFDRPKILGITSSPAGELALDRTHKKLQRLLMNLGGASLLTVSDYAEDLAKKTRHVEIDCLHSEYTHSEKRFLGILMEYATKCFNLAARVSEFKEYKDVFQPSSGGTLSKEDVVPILEVIDKFSMFSKPHTIAVNSLLHFKAICDAISAVQECGENIAIQRMTELMKRECSHGFHWAMQQDLPCENLVAYIKHFTQVCCPIEFMDSSIEKLIALLDQDINSNDTVRPLALVLVKRWQTAFRLAKYLDSSRLRNRGIRTASVVEIDAQSCLFGNPILDSTTLANIKEGHYHIVIATDPSKSCLDFPSVQLVVQLDPPSAVNALASVRAFGGGLARASYVMIARDGSLESKVKHLLLKEKNMVHAAEIINSGKTVCMY